MGDDTGSASAVPQNLYDYSKTTTGAAGLLQEFVRGTLARTLANYKATALDFGGSIQGLTADPHDVIDANVRQYLEPIVATDRSVRTTGLAFEYAGNESEVLRLDSLSVWPLHWPPVLGPHDPRAPVKTTDKTLDYVVTAAGQDLAHMLGNTDESFRTTFTQAAQDPQIAAAFLNTLSPDQLVSLLGTISDQPGQPPDVFSSLVQAYSNGRLSAKTLNAFLSMMTSAISTMDPATIQRWTAALGKALPTLDAGELKPLLSGLVSLYSAAIMHSAQPPAPGERIEAWAKGYGERVLTVIEPLLKAVKAADLNSNDQNALLKSIFQGAYINDLTTPLALLAGPEGIAAKLALSLVMNTVVGALESWLAANDHTNALGLGGTDLSANQDVLKFNHALVAKTGVLAFITTLIANGYIYDPATHQGLRLTGGPDDTELLRKISKNPELYQIVAVPGKFDITGSNGLKPATVELLIGQFLEGAPDLDPNKDLAQILSSTS